MKSTNSASSQDMAQARIDGARTAEATKELAWSTLPPYDSKTVLNFMEKSPAKAQEILAQNMHVK